LERAPERRAAFLCEGCPNDDQLRREVESLLEHPPWELPKLKSLGAIPAKIQYISVFSGAIVSGTKEPELAKRFLAFLKSESAVKAIQSSGMAPPRPLH
jgi:hypothetical protein